MKKFDQMPAISLPHVVESMQRFKKDTPFILRELKSFFKKYPSERDMNGINDLLESLAKRLDSEVMEKMWRCCLALTSEWTSALMRSFSICISQCAVSRK
jgi:hypothetical protein